MPPKKRRKKANVSGGTSLSDHLNIGNAAPQTIFAIIRHNTASL